MHTRTYTHTQFSNFKWTDVEEIKKWRGAQIEKNECWKKLSNCKQQ